MQSLAWTAGRRVLNFVFPPQCLGCRALLMDNARADSACATCFASLRFVRPPVCLSCGAPSLVEEFSQFDQTACQICQTGLEATALDRMRAAFLYQGAIVPMITGFKHADRQEAASRFAEWMLPAGRDLVPDADLLVPIPLFWSRLFKRKYNQAALLAYKLSGLTGIPSNDAVLKRRHFKKSQGHLTAEQRFINLEGALVVPARQVQAVAGKSVLLIDDVRTTGATLGVAAEALKRAGASRVDALVLALVMPKRLDYMARDNVDDGLYED